MTAEERAREIADRYKKQTYFDERCNDLAANISYQSSIISATDQRKIDIDKACEWLKLNIHKYITYELLNDDYSIDTLEFEVDFRKAMEE